MRFKENEKEIVSTKEISWIRDNSSMSTPKKTRHHPKERKVKENKGK